MVAYGISDTGKQRRMNQDYIYYSTKKVGHLQNLFIVADGMGGHAAGDFASRYTVENMVRLITKSDEPRLIPCINDSIHLVNRLLSRQAEEKLELYGMGTTLVLATIEGDVLYVANVGDSRLYLIRDDICQITRDHSYVEEMVNAGKMVRGSEEYRNRKNYITRAIGNPSGVVADFFEIELSGSWKILMCSDGLTNMIDDDTILRIVQSQDNIENCVKKLVDEANAAGGQDNISVLVIQSDDI